MTTERKKRWIPLEANPETMNIYCDALGLDTNRVSFHEVYGLDPELLSFVVRPVHAVLLLFPTDETSERAKAEEEARIERDGQQQSDAVYFMKQTVGNACGTIGVLHGILNNMDTLPIRMESFLDRFYDKTREMPPMERAKFLEDPKEGDPNIEEAHHTAAISGETHAPEPDEKVNLHFVCLVHKEGGLYELDGNKKYPIHHGATTPVSLLEDASRVAKDFMDRTSSIRFNIMVLAGQ